MCRCDEEWAVDESKVGKRSDACRAQAQAAKAHVSAFCAPRSASQASGWIDLQRLHVCRHVRQHAKDPGKSFVSQCKKGEVDTSWMGQGVAVDGLTN
mmetsp:Transcript_38460/g.78818  ORF Transcript_38460/g.78818 Transcript_38460/m.78818 type:complete len:97 (-) Transcript_38460:556-846(-)